MKPATLLLALSWLIFSGCPYQGDYMIGKASDRSIDQRLIGKWYGNAWGQEQYLEIKAQGENKYFVTVKSVNSDNTEHTLRFYEATPGKFKGSTILNLRKATASGDVVGEQYFYFRYDFNDGTLTTHNLASDEGGGNWPAFSSEEEWNTYLKKHWTEEGFWNDWTMWQKL